MKEHLVSDVYFDSQYFEKGEVYKFTCANPNMIFQPKYQIDERHPIYGVLLVVHPILLEFEILYTSSDDRSIHAKVWGITTDVYKRAEIKITRMIPITDLDTLGNEFDALQEDINENRAAYPFMRRT
jgi:hypothetical protein